MKTAYLTQLLVLAMHAACCQSGPFLFSGTNYLSNGQIGILTDNAESSIELPARLADIKKAGWTAAASLRTGVSDLIELAAAGHIPLSKNSQIALGIQHTGIEGYSEQRITISYCRKILQQLSAAVQFDLNRNSVVEYEDLYAPSWSVSIIAPLMNKISMAAYIYNPLGTTSTIQLPSVARLSALYEPSEKLSVAIEAEKQWLYDLRFKAGINYRMHPRLAVRWGASTEPSMIHAGISWNILNNMTINGGWRYHTRLGSVMSAAISQKSN